MSSETEKIIKACWDEFCDCIGDSPCGCDICPYSGEDGNCYEKYKQDKLQQLKEGAEE